MSEEKENEFLFYSELMEMKYGELWYNKYYIKIRNKVDEKTGLNRISKRGNNLIELLVFDKEKPKTIHNIFNGVQLISKKTGRPYQKFFN